MLLPAWCGEVPSVSRRVPLHGAELRRRSMDSAPQLWWSGASGRRPRNGGRGREHCSVRCHGAFPCGGGELRRPAWLPQLGRIGSSDFGLGEIRAKALHRPRSLPAMSTSSDVAPLVGGIVEDLLHLPCRFESQTLRMKILASALAGEGVSIVIVASLLGASPWRSGTSKVCGRLFFFVPSSSARRGRGPGTGVDVGAAAPKTFALSIIPPYLGGLCRRLEWCAASGPVCGVELSRFWPVFPNKLAVRVLGMSLNIPLYRFSASFPYKLANFFLLYQ